MALPNGYAGIFPETQVENNNPYFQTVPINKAGSQASQGTPETPEEAQQALMLLQQQMQINTMDNAMLALAERDKSTRAMRNANSVNRINSAAATGDYNDNNVSAKIGKSGNVEITGIGPNPNDIGQGLMRASNTDQTLFAGIKDRVKSLYSMEDSVEKAQLYSGIQTDLATTKAAMFNDIYRSQTVSLGMPGIDAQIAQERQMMPYGEVTTPKLTMLMQAKSQVEAEAGKQTAFAMKTNVDLIDLETSVTTGINTAVSLGKVQTAENKIAEALQAKVFAKTEEAAAKAGPLSLSRVTDLNLLSIKDAGGNVVPATELEKAQYIIGLKDASPEKRALSAIDDDALITLATTEDNVMAKQLLKINKTREFGEDVANRLDSQVQGFKDLMNSPAKLAAKAKQVFGTDAGSIALVTSPGTATTKEKRRARSELVFQLAKEVYADTQSANFQNNVAGWPDSSLLKDTFAKLSAAKIPLTMDAVGRDFVGEGSASERVARQEQFRQIVIKNAQAYQSKELFQGISLDELSAMTSQYLVGQSNFSKFMNSVMPTLNKLDALAKNPLVNPVGYLGVQVASAPHALINMFRDTTPEEVLAQAEAEAANRKGK